MTADDLARMLEFLAREAGTCGGEVAIFWSEDEQSYGVRNRKNGKVTATNASLLEAIRVLADEVVQRKTEKSRAIADEAVEGETLLAKIRSAPKDTPR